ncbi:MAG: hypothetical protein K2G24_00235 [Muribaculaceae bacterium]|nr:hypothetical protein [Muribaculaceae bacterium]
MKRFLLYSLVALAAMCARAEATYTYGICTDHINGVGTGQTGTNYSAAIEVPEDVAKAMQGSRITAVDLAIRSGQNKVVNVYLTYDLESEPFYKQEGNIKLNTFTEIVLDQPYEIEGRRFYIGYTYRQTTSTGQPIGFDSSDLAGMGMFSNLAFWADGQKPVWNQYPGYGALNIRATIEGDNQPENAVVPVGMSLPKSVGINRDFSYEVDLLNIGVNSVQNVSTTAMFGQDGPVETPVQFDEALAPGARCSVRLTGRTSQENPELPVSFAVEQVNGNANLFASAQSLQNTIASDYIFPRVVVIEEGTGTGCGWCPAGYIAMEEMRENHPDDYIGIAVHNYGGDPMECATYDAWNTSFAGGYPKAVINRSREIGVFSPQPATCETLYKNQAGVVNLNLTIRAGYADAEKSALRVVTKVTFGSDIESHNYGFALVQTEDNVGPYYQMNNYAGGANGGMGGFENKSNPVSLMYNDVARRIDNWNGTGGNLPAELRKGETYRYEAEMPIASPILQNHANTNVIALLIDRNTGEIVTAAKCKIDENSAVDEIDMSGVEVRALSGAVEIEGEFERADVFRADGTCAATVAGASRVALAPGLYVVRVLVSGKATTSKVIVK